MVTNDILQVLVPVMIEYKSDTSLTELSIKLIANYGACQTNEDSIQLHIRKRGCHDFIAHCIDYHNTYTCIITIAMECLYNMNTHWNFN